MILRTHADPETRRRIFDYHAYLIDLDGVVFRGQELCPGAREFVDWLSLNGKKYLFLTNSSAASQSSVRAKLSGLGIQVGASQVLSAGEAAVRTIAKRFPGGRVLLVGEPDMQQLLLEHGLREAELDAEHVDVVLCCLDRSFNYAKLAVAVRAVRQGAVFIAANRDSLLPVQGSFLPGCGALVAAIEAASGVSPEVIGKPQRAMFLEGMAKLGTSPENTVVLGDSLNIDILGAKQVGADTILLLSGVTRREELAHASIRADHVFDNLGAILNAIDA